MYYQSEKEHIMCVCVCVGAYLYLQIIQQRSSEAHFSQGHVGMTAVQKALDLSADVQSQRLSPLDLLWTQCCPCVIVLLQPLLNM